MSMRSKVPAVTLAFWIIKICATTAGETAGDALSMTLGLGYAVSTFIFVGLLIALLGAATTGRAGWTPRGHRLGILPACWQTQ